MRSTLISLAALAACALIPAGAAADTITVVPEPAGDNCANGGQKITVTADAPPPPAPAPQPQVSFVCNGEDGQDGAPGPPGDPGADGQPGTDGADGVDGINGMDGSNGSNGSSGSSASSSGRASCGKASRVVSMTMPVRYRDGVTVAVNVSGHRYSVHVRNRQVRVDLRNLGCGSFPVVVKRAGVRPVVRIFTLHPGGRVGRTPVVG